MLVNELIDIGENKKVCEKILYSEKDLGQFIRNRT